MVREEAVHLSAPPTKRLLRWQASARHLSSHYNHTWSASLYLHRRVGIPRRSRKLEHGLTLVV